MKPQPSPSVVASRTFLAYAILMFAWTAAWLLKLNLDSWWPAVRADGGALAYWTIAKAAIWIAPACWLIWLSGRSLADVVAVRHWRRWLIWGVGGGLVIALTGWAARWLGGRPLWPSEFSFALVNVLLIAPVFEEWLMRGAILVNLQQRWAFWPANFLTALMFLGLHVPGWYFMDSLGHNVVAPVGGALSIVLLGLIFGYLARRGRSVAAAMIGHALNNLAAS